MSRAPRTSAAPTLKDIIKDTLKDSAKVARLKVTVLSSKPHTEWPGYRVEEWECGHGTVTTTYKRNNTRVCRICSAEGSP